MELYINPKKVEKAVDDLKDSLIKTVPLITSVTTVINVENSHTFQDGTKSFQIQSQNCTEIQLGLAAGHSGTNFITIPPGANHGDSLLKLTARTIYFRTNENDIVKIFEWT